MNTKTIIIIADPHLESQTNDVNCMMEFIRTLKPTEHILIFLGDLFHVWVGPTQYHTEQEKQLLDELQKFRSLGGTNYLIVGNRDLFFKASTFASDDTGLPFDAVYLDDMKLDFENGLLMAHHGDTVNSKNKQYFIWRKIVRSAWAEFIFRLIPAQRWKTILWGIEKKMKETNKEFRSNFPDEEWAMYVERVHKSLAPKLLLVGHFHPKKPVITRYAGTTGIVVPAWQGTRTYLKIDAKLNYQFQTHAPNKVM